MNQVEQLKKTYDAAYCFEHPKEVLYSGFCLLKNSNPVDPYGDLPAFPGNYIINYGDLYYAGEAERIKNRIAQQFDEGRSTFYHNYLKYPTENHVSIRSFSLRIIQTTILRKELEEFCIVNLPARLNRFQLHAQDVYRGMENQELWAWMQSHREEYLDYIMKKLDEVEYRPWSDAMVEPCGGVYMIAHEGDGVIYVGESSSVRERYQTHSTTTRFSAFRRHVATEVLGFTLRTAAESGRENTADQRRMYVFPEEDTKIDRYISTCAFKCLQVPLGRFEFEKYLIHTSHPVLNIRDNA